MGSSSSQALLQIEVHAIRQFSVRDMLFTFVIVALALGWWFDRRPILARFQMHVTTNHAFVLDTATGEVWDGRINESGFVDGSQLRGAKLPE